MKKQIDKLRKSTNTVDRAAIDAIDEIVTMIHSRPTSHLNPKAHLAINKIIILATAHKRNYDFTLDTIAITLIYITKSYADELIITGN